jgi:hypothetical protein
MQLHRSRFGNGFDGGFRSALLIAVLAVPRWAAAQQASDAEKPGVSPASGSQGAAQPAAPAVSATATDEQKAAARAAYASGQQAFNSGDFQAALQYFERADSMIPAIQARYWIAQSLDQLGRPADSLAAYEKLVNDPEFANLDAERQKIARDRLEALKQLPGTLTLSFDPPSANLTVDGQPHDAAAAGATRSLQLAPGVHKLEARAPGYQDLKWDVMIEPAQTLEQPIRLTEAPPAAPATALAPAPVEPPPAPLPAAEPASKTPAYVTLAIAGAGAVVGTIFGIRALQAKDDFDSNPTANNADDVERDALIADMAFGITLTLGITGIVLLTTDDPASESAAGSQTRKASAKLTPATKQGKLEFTPYVSKSGGGAGARLTF